MRDVDLTPRELMERRVVAAVRAAAGAHVLAVPDADLPEHDHRRQRRDREPRQAALPVREHDEGRQQRPERRPRVAADLEERLREAVLSSGCQPGDSRRLRMEDRRADADQRGGREHSREMVGPRQEQQTRQRESHADGQRLRLRLAIGEIADHRLEERRGELVGERDQADVPEVERERGLEDRIDRRQQRLDHVVEQVTDAERADHGIGGPAAVASHAVSRRDLQRRFFRMSSRTTRSILPSMRTRTS